MMQRNIRTPADSDVTEQQELSEISSLLLLASDKADSNKLGEAKALAFDALEIDETHVDVLSFLVDINIRLQKYEEAFHYAECLIDVHPDNPLGPLCKAKSQCQMEHYRDSVSSSLKCLSMKYSQPREASQLIVKAVQEILGLSENFSINLQDMDYYAQLGEVGIVLLAAKQYVMVIKVLEVALKLQTIQYGVSMRIYLTQGHALCAVQKHEAALKAYENCLSMAASSHDVAHQTKALVNIAALHVSLGETYKALVVYERLLDMHSRLLSDMEVCDDVWTEEFIAGLYMNASIAYKTVGNIDMALHYAQKYLHNIQDTSDYTGLSLIHRHIGMLYEMVCRFSQALFHYNSYLAMAKCSANPLEIALAYGHLGSVFGLIGLFPLSLVYHNRHISGVCNVLNSVSVAGNDLDGVLAGKSEVKKAAVQAYEMYGDTLMRRQDYEEANNLYQLMFKHCDRGALDRSRALYKTGNSHLSVGNSQHSLHFYEQALNLCDDEFVHLMEDIKYGIALSVQTSSTSAELEKGKKYFQQSIDSFKLQIEECVEHHKFLPDGLISKLADAFQGVQMVLAKLGCDTECLEYAEDFRLFITRLTSKGAPFSRLPSRLDFSVLKNTVSSQGASVLYYSFLANTLLIWILSPGKGLQRFYVKRPQKLKDSVELELQAMVTPWLTKLADAHNKQLYKCERRSVERKLPKDEPKSLLEKRLKSNILKRNSSWTQSEKQSLLDYQSRDSEEHMAQPESDDESQIERKLYKFLAGPVDDIISKIPKNGQLIIIPDRVICQIPFNRLRDLKGKPLGDRLNITYLSGIYALKLVVENQIRNLQLEDGVNFVRTQSSLGGYYRYLHSAELQYRHDEELQTPAQTAVNRRKVSNPRLGVILRSLDNKSSSTKRPSEDLAEDNTRRWKDSDNSVTGRLVQIPAHTESLYRRHTFHQMDNQLYSIGRPITPGHGGKHRKSQSGGSTVPQPCYHRPVERCGNAMSVCKLLRTDNLSTLITTCSTGTDALTSTTDIPEYSQISDMENFVVVGNPHISSRMMLGVSPLPTPEAYAHKLMKSELETVSEILGCDYIFDKQATKQHFLEVAAKATVLHIVTQVNLAEGMIVMSCDDSRLTNGDPIEEKYYLVTVDDITKLNMRAKLVVISGGWSIRHLQAEQGSLQTLPNAFILAGAESVLTLPHPLTSETFSLFFRLFYSIFQQSCDVCRALNIATKKVATFCDLPFFPAHIYGNNVTISITDVKSAMLDQNINSIESEVCAKHGVPPLNEPDPRRVPTLTEQLTKMQKCIGEICGSGDHSSDIIENMLQLVNDAITVVEDSVLQVPNLVVLPFSLIAHSPSIDLLKLLKFNFEPRGLTQQLCEPAVLFPSRDPDGLLRRVSSILQSLLDVKLNAVRKILHDLLPMQQKLVTNIIDVLALTMHSTDVQLHIHDDSLAGLWTNSDCRALLKCVGFHQIGTMLHFGSTRPNQRLLKPLLKLFIMISVSKPESLISKLDVSLLGNSNQEAENEKEADRLPTVLPVLLSKDKLLRRVPWSSRMESSEEILQKKVIAQKYWQNEAEFNMEKRKLLELELSTAKVQAQEILRDYSIPKHTSSKLKVLSGSTASKGRVPVGYVPPLTAAQFEQRRKYSDYLRKSRISELALREKHENRKLLHSYTDIIN